MSITLSRTASTGLFFLFIFLSGFWLSYSGKPLNAFILAIHKLIALAAVVFLFRTVYQINQAAGLSKPELIASVVTGLFFLATIIIGGLLSTDKPMPAAITRMHQVMPFLTVLSTAATFYFLGVW